MTKLGIKQSKIINTQQPASLSGYYGIPSKMRLYETSPLTKKRREKYSRRKDSEKSKCCISCALRGGVQRGPIKGLDAAAQMRYTHTKGRRYFDCRGFPPVSFPPLQLNTKRGKVARANKRIRPSGWRAPRVHNYA